MSWEMTLMDRLKDKIKQSYDSAELPEELRLRVRREFLAAAQEQSEKGGITMNRRIRRPISAILIAAAALTVTITAGAAAYGIFHKESIDNVLGEGAADAAASKVGLSSISTENEYFRITADAVFCDGHSAVIFVTKERLTDPDLGWMQTEDGGWLDMVQCEVSYADGSGLFDDRPYGAGSCSSYYDVSEPTENGVTYERWELNDIDPGRSIEITFTDRSNFDVIFSQLDEEGRNELFAREDYEEYYDEMIHPEHVQGLSLIIDTTQNFTPVTYEDEQGRQLSVTPYRLDSYDGMSTLCAYDFILKNSETGEEKTINMRDGSDVGGSPDEPYYTSYNYSEYVPDIEDYDIIEVVNYGTFYRK